MRRSWIVAIVVTGTLLLSGCAEPPARVASHGPWEPTPGMPLTEPRQLFSENGVLRLTLTGHRKTIEVSGSALHARPWNGALIGPTLRVHPGDTIRITMRNRIGQMTNIHYHGLHVSPRGRSDNVFRMIHGQTTAWSVVHVPVDHNPGTFWYHVHHHGNTGTQISGGMSGLLIVEGLEDLLPQDLQDITQRQLALRDLQHVDGRVVIASNSSQPTTRLINGLLEPTMSIAPGETQLWRLANVGADLYYNVELEGHTFHVITEDGFPVWDVWEADRLVLPPGKRFDVLVQGGSPGSYAFRTVEYDQGFQLLPTVGMASVEVAGEPQTTAAIPSGLYDRAVGDLTNATVTTSRTFTFTIDDTTTPDTFLINGKAFDLDRLDVAPVLGTVEEWTLINDSPQEHPFHIHINDFQVMSIDGEPYDARGLQDVVNLPRGSEVVIRNPFEDFTGKYVFHCHIGFHEDHGMMMSVKVVE